MVVLLGVVLAYQGVMTARLARRQLRPPGRWFAYGACTGPLAIRILRAAPPGVCGTCLSPVPGWSFVCGYCGSDVRLRPQLVPANAGRPTPAMRDEAASLPTVTHRQDVDSTPDLAHAVLAVPRAKIVRRRYLATAMYAGGSEPLRAGTWYQMTVYGSDLRITGPVSSLPRREVISHPLRDLVATAEDDRLVIRGATKQLGGYELVFSAVREGTPTSVTAEFEMIQGTLAADTPRLAS